MSRSARKRPRAAKRPEHRFDAAYYRRYYLDPETQVYDQERHTRLVAAVVNAVEWLNGPIQGVLDVGAGVGWWGDWLKANRPGVNLVSTELDPEVCARYGHLQADLTTLKLPLTFDLVICQGVLPYLDDAQVRLGLSNLASMCGAFLYLEAVTKEDAKETLDPTRTDMTMTLRPEAFYRKELAKHFVQVGFGLWAKKDADVMLYALEKAPASRRSAS